MIPDWLFVAFVAVVLLLLVLRLYWPRRSPPLSKVPAVRQPDRRPDWPPKGISMKKAIQRRPPRS